MPLSRLENFLKNAEGNILYVSPSDFDSSDSFENQGNSLTRPFKTIQRALIEAARFSYQNGKNNDKIDRTTILVYPGTHYIDNRPGFSITSSGSNAIYKKRTGATTWSQDILPEFGTSTNYDILNTNNDIYKFNSVNGGVILPRGTSIIGYDLRKTKIRPLYVPNPEDSSVDLSSIFNVTGTCYFSIFTFLDADTTKTVFRDYTDNRFVPNYSHHKLTAFAYADGVNKVVLGTEQTTLTDLDMYYYKIARAYGDITGRGVLDYPGNDDFETSVDEYRIVGSLQANPLGISSIFGGNGVTNPTNLITVTTKNSQTGDETPHGLFVDSPVLISGITADVSAFNGSFTVKEVVGLTTFTYTSTASPSSPTPQEADYETGIVTIEADSVSSASPYVFGCSIRSVYGMCGMWADGSKADGFKSMVVAQFTGVSLQKDDNAFLIYENGSYKSNATLSNTSTERPLHTNGNAIYKPSYENAHIRVSNNGFIQCVSIFAIGFAKHFLTESGGDMSITNSNSNFGALSLESIGFRNESFDRDDVGYITHIIPPKELDTQETEIGWLSFDVTKTISVGIASHLYLYNYNNPDISPTSEVDNYRIGAKVNDNLNLTVVVGTAQTNYTSPILMPVPSGTGISSKKSYTVSRSGNLNQITSNIFTLDANHQLYNGETVRVFADTGQAPDGISIDTVYYAITTGLGTNEVQLAFSLNDAIAGQEITGILNNGGILTIQSSVTDKLPNELGSPIQYDTTNLQWYINCSSTSSNQIYSTIVGLGTTALGLETASSFVKRKTDTRAIEDRIYRVRYVVPKEFNNARPPQAGFVLQESKTVGVSIISFDTAATLTNSTPPAYLRNEKIISNASVGAVSGGKQTVTITTELPHGFIVGDKANVQKIRSTNNTLGVGLTGTYNGSYYINSVPSTKQFTYEISGVKINPGTFANLINERDTRQERDQLPLVSREEYQGNYFIYRVDTIKKHIPGTDGQDGIYNLIVLSSNITTNSNDEYGISAKLFNQDLRNLYPQIDRDNFNADPTESISCADIKTLGKVITDDKKKSITKETVNSFLKNTRIGFGITNVSSTGTASTIVTLYTDVEHNLNSIKSLTVTTPGAGYGNTTIYASSLIGIGLTGTNASVRATLDAGTISTVSIIDSGSAYSVGNNLTVSGSPGITPSINSVVNVSAINNNIGDGIELSGFTATNLNGVYKITNVPTSNTIEIYVPSGLPSYTQNTNSRKPVAILASKGVGITSFKFANVSTGIVTVTTNGSHGLLPGNKFTIVGSGHTIYDSSFIVKDNVGINTFTFNVGIATQTKVSTTGTLLKHGISANGLNFTRGEDNLGSRTSYIYAGITTTLTSTLTTSSSTITLTSANGFKRGDYVLINAEIARLASTNTGNTFTVLRGKFSTYKTTAVSGTQVKKITVLPMEVRRPSFMRASGHTFEYLGYGPGNYSTGMPQKQTRTLSEDDILTSQAKEQRGGTVVYTGMNDLGEFYSGTKKLSSSTGEEKVIDSPIITYTGDDAQGENNNRLSGIYDDMLVKERITVEGGLNGNQSSQFYGPVNFTKKVTNTSDDGINTKNLFIKGTSAFGKLITVGISTPTNPDFDKLGNISLKSNPSLTDGYIGQVYVDSEWKKFGLISQSKDILDIKIDRLGIGDPSVFDGPGGGVGNAELYVAGDVKIQNLTVTGSTVFANDVVLNDVNFSRINLRETIFFTGEQKTDAGTAKTSIVIDVSPPNIDNSNTRLKTKLYDLDVAGISTVTSLDASGPVYVDDTLNVTGIATVNALNINTTGVGEGDIASNGGTDGVFGIFNTSNSGSFSFNAKNSGGTYNDILVLSNTIASIDGNLGIGTVNPTSKLVVNGFFGLNESGANNNAGRTLFSTSASGFVLNHNHASSLSFQTQGTERFNIGLGTVTYVRNNAGENLNGAHFKLRQDGDGDVVLSWFAKESTNQRWYVGIDTSDSNSWKIAHPNSLTAAGNESFDGAGETKFKIAESGDVSIFGGLTLNTNKFIVAGATGNTTIAGTLGINGNTTITGGDFSINTSSNTNKFKVFNATGNTEIQGTFSANGDSTFGGTLGVTGNITGAAFVKTNGGSTGGVSNILRANGTDAPLVLTDVTNALGFVPQPPITVSSLPTGNSIVLKDISGSFNGTNITFQLQNSSNVNFYPIGGDNLIVSLGGVIQKSGTDYTIDTSGSSFTNIIRFTTAPVSGLSCFILALGGQGSLVANQDWSAEGQMLVSTADNAAKLLNIGSDDQILTVDTTVAGKVAWKTNFGGNAASATTAASCSGNAVSATTATGVSATISINTTGIITATTFSGNGITPIGGIIMWSGTLAAITNLTGWKLCDGQNGTPDLRNRFIIGASVDANGQSNTNVTGANTKSGGTKDATLVSHNHTGTTGGHSVDHTHGFNNFYYAENNGNASALGLGPSYAGSNKGQDNDNIPFYIDWTTGGTSANHSHDFATSTAGSSGENANLPPYFALAYIMRVS